jgi:hypothetical protein
MRLCRMGLCASSGDLAPQIADPPENRRNESANRSASVEGSRALGTLSAMRWERRTPADRERYQSKYLRLIGAR